MVLTLVACEKDPNWTHQTISHRQTIVTTLHSAHISVQVDEASNAILQSIYVLYDINADFSAPQSASLTLNDNKWQVMLQSLEMEKTYFVRYIISPSYLPKWETDAFLTTNPLVPLASTMPASNITATTAKLHGEASVDDNYEITERGFYYSLLKDTDYERKQVKCGSGEGRFEAKIEALRANATYYIVAYAVNKNGIAYGDTLQFNTLNPYQQ